MKKFLAGILLLMLFVAVVSPSVFADARADYERYISAYNAYRNAVLEKKPVAEIKGLLDAYQDAKNSYEGNLSRTTDKVLDGAENTAVANSGENYDEYVDTDTSTAGATATSQTAQLPEGLKRILSELWSEKGRKSPDAMMKLLSAYVESNPNSKFVGMAQYELAKAYDLLKDDQVTSAKLLQSIVKRQPDSKLANIANQRLAYYTASKNHEKWKQVLNASYADSQESYAKYRNTSWLAFPVKAVRWTGYVKKLFSFNSNQDKYEKFQIWYENMGARFAPPVDIIFDKFRPATGYASETAEVSLRYSNSDAWYSRWKLLNEARHTIDIQYFIVDKDIFGMSMLGLLLKKAKEGLKIRLMMDARGTKQLTRKLQGQDFLQELTEMPNCEVKVFNPVHSNLLTAITDIRKAMASNHDKILVVDGEYCVIGGRNISKDYFLDPEDHPGCYRDCDVVVRSREVSAQLVYAFDEEFSKLKTYSVGKELFGNIDIMSAELFSANDTMYNHILNNEKFTVSPNVDKKYINSAKVYLKELADYSHLRNFTGFDPFANSVDAPVKIIDKHSLGGPRNDITDQMVRYIDGCKSEILIQNPYVVLTDRVFAALQRAGRKGVVVKIHTNSPYSTDSLATQAMFYADWKKVLSEIPGARIFVFYGTRKLHAKTWVFDKKIGVVGTYNLDYMSEQINSEVVAAVKSDEFAKELRDGIMSDMNASKEYKVTVDANGNVEGVFGPDDLKGKNFWLLKTLSKFTIIKKLI